jgi:primary-amine oxidase
MLAKPGSLVYNRAPFARHNVSKHSLYLAAYDADNQMFVTPYNEEELFPSDIHINQNRGGEDFGLQKWVNRDENVRNTDIVCWPCFGVTHISRPEDWPIMPVEILRVHLKPSGFFDVSLQQVDPVVTWANET